MVRSRREGGAAVCVCVCEREGGEGRREGVVVARSVKVKRAMLGRR